MARIEVAMRDFPEGGVESPPTGAAAGDRASDEEWEALPRSPGNLTYQVSHAAHVETRALFRSLQLNPSDRYLPEIERQALEGLHEEALQRLWEMREGVGEILRKEIEHNKRHAVAANWELLPVSKRAEITDGVLKGWASRRGTTVEQERRRYLLGALDGYTIVDVEGETRLLHESYTMQSGSLMQLVTEYSRIHARAVVSWFQGRGCLTRDQASELFRIIDSQ